MSRSIDTKLLSALTFSAVAHFFLFQFVGQSDRSGFLTPGRAANLAVTLGVSSIAQAVFPPVVNATRTESRNGENQGAIVNGVFPDRPGKTGGKSSIAGVVGGQSEVGILTRYYRSNEVEERASPVEEIPDFSLLSVRDEGYVVLRLLIGSVGLVDRVDVAESTVPHELEAFTTHLFKNAEFRPAKISGEPVPSVILIRIDVAPTVN